ncbi:MAG TPA: LuxR C-terminal-related transcriptional regulator [Solirubrobacterales bacterium]|jgi:DNA-binding CsgD family transcriptional regulator|nr:LuxR C-terminal-related transcriptional regulator [Solirubrobacterales bacterium]
MPALAAADLRMALDFIADAHSFESVDAFRHGILPGLQRLLPSDLVGYNEVDPGGEALVLTYPDQVPPAVNLELPRLAHQHPLICVQLNGDCGTYKISDFLSARQFHALELYEGLYKQIGAEDQIACGLGGRAVIGIAMNRDRRSFSERDRAMLDLLRPHLAQAHGRVLERERAVELLAALEQGLAERGSSIALVEGDGTIAHLSGPALNLLDSYFPERRGAILPAPIAEWLAAGAGAPLVAETAAGRLTICARPGSGTTVLILDESAAITPERLLPLGLTSRQAEVLALLAGGAGVEQIARELFVSPATVRKHLEHVYTRLGVHSRAEAIERARAA